MTDDYDVRHEDELTRLVYEVLAACSTCAPRLTACFAEMEDGEEDEFQFQPCPACMAALSDHQLYLSSIRKN